LAKILKSLLKIGLLVLILVLLFLVGSYGFLWYAAKSCPAKINAEIELIRAANEPVEIDQLLPKNVAENENAAPIYLKTLEEVGKLSDDFPWSAKLIKYNKHHDVINELLDKNPKIFELMKAAFEKPECSYDFCQAPGQLSLKFEEKETARLIFISLYKSFSQVEKKDLTGAAQTLAYCMKFIRTMQPDFYFNSVSNIQYLQALISGGIRHLLDAGYAGSFPPFDAEVKLVSKLNPYFWLKALYGERAVGIALFNLPPDQLDQFLVQYCVNEPDINENVVKIMTKERNTPFMGLYYYDQLNFLRWYRQVIAEYRNTGDIPAWKHRYTPYLNARVFCAFTLASSYNLMNYFPNRIGFLRLYQKLGQQVEEAAKKAK